jgi:iron complex transport system ATP-binding protein
MNAGTMALLAAENLTIGYGAAPVAGNISLVLRPGEVTCLLGPNGVGKTTLFKTLLGLIPPLAGQVVIGGRDLAALSRAAVARHIAYVPQAYISDFAYTVLDLVVMGRTAYLGAFAAPGRTDYAIAMEALGALGIAGLADRDANRISGGQRQLALIARALAQRAGAVVMDEPTASLDLGNRLMVLGRITALAKDGLAVLISTHEPEQAFAIADRVAVLGPGNHFVTGPVDAVLTPGELTRLYGVPLSVERTSSGRLVVVPDNGAAQPA